MSSAENSKCKKTVLKNGLRILTIPHRGTQAAVVFVLVGTGSKYETKRTNGISHFLEHMLFKGTKKRPTPREVVEVVESVGGVNNAFTAEDWTGYFAKVDASHVSLAIDWVADIFLYSVLAEKEMMKEKGVVIEEINMDRDNPMRHVSELWPQLLYGDQPAGWDIAGTKESVLGLTREDLLSYREKQYVASNTIVCVAGKIREKEVIGKIQEAFREIPQGTPLKKKALKEGQGAPAVLLEYRKTDQTHFVVGGRGYALSDPRRYASKLLALVLGGGMSSRLFLKLRDELGLAYYVHTESDSDPETGSVATAAGVRNELVGSALRAVLKEYRAISEKGAGKEELEKAKSQMKGQFALALEASEAKAEFFLMQEMLEGKISSPEEMYARIEKVKGGDVQKAAQDIFSRPKLNLVVLGPYRDKERFEKLMKI